MSTPSAPCSASVPDIRVRATERWFCRRGLPLLIEDYRSSTNVWTRTSPALAVCYYDRIRMDLERSLSVRQAYVLLYRRG